MSISRRILFLTPQQPYPTNRGTALRNFGLIEGLARRGHAVSLMTFREADQPPIAETPLSDLCRNVVTADVPPRTRADRVRDLIAGKTDMAARLWSEGFAQTLREHLSSQDYDVVHIEGIEMAPYLPVIREYAPDAMRIYDAHNAEYALQRRIAGQDWRKLMRWHAAAYSTVQARRLRRYEATTCADCQHIVAVSEADAELLRALAHQTPVTVIPNAIRTADYDPGDHPPANMPQPTLVFTGKMDYRPNIDAALWFAEDILPLIRERVRNAHFAIVGQKPHTRLDKLRGRDDVTITGFVDDIRAYIRAAAVYVAPLRMGSGTRFKLLEAMAMQRAVVSTRIGAEGISVADGVHLRLGDSAQEFAAAVADLLADEAARTRLGEAGATLVRDQYDWSAIIPTLEDVYSAA